MAESELKQKRGRIKASLTRLCSYIENTNNETRIEDIQIRYERLDKLWDEFIKIDDELNQLSVASDIEEFETSFFTTSSLYRQALNTIHCSSNQEENQQHREHISSSPQLAVEQLNSTLSRFVDQQKSIWDSHITTSQHNDIKLPKANIPTFTGDIKEWATFKELFVTIIDVRDNLSAIQKFQYLKGLVAGEAASLIKHLPITENNYKEAWEKLQKRYDQKKHIITEYIKSFYCQSSITQSSATALRTICDTSDELIRGVNALGTNAQGRDPWLVFIILSKTDPDTRKAWAEETVDNDIPTLELLFKFLNKRCDALQACEQPIKRTPSKSNVIKSYHLDRELKCIKCHQSHPLFKCTDFKRLEVLTRREFVSKHALCFNCLSRGHRADKCKSTNLCHFCKKNHHSLLHQEPESDKVPSNQSGANKSSENQLNVNASPFNSNITSQNIDNSLSITSLTTHHKKNTSIAILPTAVVQVYDRYNKLQFCRILIDSGSQASFISERCAHRLGKPRQPDKFLVQGIGSCKSGLTRGHIYLTLCSRIDINENIKIVAHVLPKLTTTQPPLQFNMDTRSLPKGIHLADPHFNEPHEIDMLLGAEHFIQILKHGKVVKSGHNIGLQNTIFGYIASGSVNTDCENHHITSLHADIADVDKTLRAFWEIEELSTAHTTYTEEEKFCEDLFLQTHFTDQETGKYVVRLPIKNNEKTIGDTITIATSRLKTMEKKFTKNISFRDEYYQFMKEYKTLKHMESVPTASLHTKAEIAYLPHHAILKPSSSTTKLRVVFDGSAMSSSGLTLNQKLCVGPKVQRDLFQILLAFRTFQIAVIADIQKMYRQVLVNEADRDYQRILWRDSSSQPVNHFRLTTVTYGTSAAPFLATRALKQTAEEFKNSYPLAAKAILENFYVDDFLGGANDINTAIKLHKELTTVLSSRGFPLHKWASNSTAFLSAISEQNATSSLQIQEHSESLKVLGLTWKSANDCFTIDVNTSTNSILTKRFMLSEISKIFDPLGLLSPVTVTFKMMLQQLWLENYTWDDQIQGPLTKKWVQAHTELSQLAELRIPRWLNTTNNQFELHGFSDASERAYAAVVYCRAKNLAGNAVVTLVAAKTRIAPVKQISIPRLELNGALLLSKLMINVCTALDQPNIDCIAWTDSKIVLAWLSTHPCHWKTYIANRTSEILNTLPRSAWHHVRSQDNPADMASRGISTHQLSQSRLWWSGPLWLAQNWSEYENNIPANDTHHSTNLEKRNRTLQCLETTLVNDTLCNLLERHSCLNKILRIIARCLQFLKYCRDFKSSIGNRWLTSIDLNYAHQICIKWTQHSAFINEIDALTNDKTYNNSTIKSLHPFLDSHGVLRVGGRLEKSSCAFNTKHPIILPKNNPYVILLINHLHHKYFHIGTNGLLNIIRQRYWIVSCRTMVKKCIKSCIQCVKQRGQTAQQLMASLPFSRTSYTRAFENIGIDYAGPYSLLRHRGRGARSYKGYIANFICFNTRAIHIELATDLSSDAFLACLKRFISRRGIPTNIYSDNGTNFIGANKQLHHLFKNASQYNPELITNFAASNGISWHFNPPAAPHFGGNWESGVKLIKVHLKRTIGNTKLTYEEFSTLLTQIEGVLNSRPLTPVSDDIDCYDVLTPGHFIIGKPLVALPEPSSSESTLTLNMRWKMTQKMFRDIWNRWYKEYLVTLQHRPKWQQEQINFNINDLVLIKEDNMAPGTWALGRITQLHPGQDGLVRVVTLKTMRGDFKRPINKLCKLPLC